jgi:hypothetical protein
MSVQQYWANCSSTVASCSSVAGARMQDIVQCAQFFFATTKFILNFTNFYMSLLGTAATRKQIPVIATVSLL